METGTQVKAAIEADLERFDLWRCSRAVVVVVVAAVVVVVA